VSTSRNRSRSTGGQSRTAGGSQQQRRDEKRAQFEQPRIRTGLHIAAAVGALVVVAVVAFVIVSGRGGSEPATATAAAAPGGDVSIPLAEISDGQAHFYTYDAGGTEVKYFVMKSSDGEYRAAFDACDVCYAQKKGYQQQGDEMVCNNCGRRFPSTKINVLEGGCNPSPVERTVQGENLILNAQDLQTGVQYF